MSTNASTVAVTPLEYLFGLELHGVKLGLSNITHLLSRADNPHHIYPTVHVAGTNGKGSVVALLDTMLRAAGYTTGRFTSPHLCDIRERFLVGGRLIPEDELDENITFFRDIAHSMAQSPTFFEINTAIAFRHFAQRPVDIALIEVGMGGRFDSTNVITPAAAAITTIALEHTRFLGNTLESIAFEKAGIIKSDVPLILTETQPGPRKVILDRAKALESPVTLLDRDFHFQLTGPSAKHQFSYQGARLSLGPVPLGLPGAYQGRNAAAATALAEALQPAFPALDHQSITQGLATALWPCRLERILDDPPVILDVAHNAAGARELAAVLEPQSIIILAVSADKDAAAILQTLAPKAATLILTEFTGTRALPLDALCQAAGPHPYRRAATLQEAIADGMALAAADHPLIIAGSLYAAGEARTILTNQYQARPLRF